MSSLGNLSDTEKGKVKQVINSGELVLIEIDDLKETMKEYVVGLSEELDIKPAIINKAIRMAHKMRQENAMEIAQNEMNEVEQILHAAGKI